MQLKHGNVHNGVNAAAQLLVPERPLEAQHFGYALLQYLVNSLSRSVCSPPSHLSDSTLFACRSHAHRGRAGRSAVA